jgi:uncharacterized membrane protein YphA (DoxX/SURF4 family)
MRIASPGHAAFAAMLTALGLVGFLTGEFAGVWGGVPQSLPMREALPYACAFVALASGLGMLWRRTAAFATGALLVYTLIWLIVFKGQFVIRAPLQEVSYQTCGETATIVAGAWVLYAWFAPEWDERRLPFATGDNGVRIARVLFGLALITFGLSHFFYVQLTAPLVPTWLGWPVGWAYFTGGTYLAAGLAVLSGVLARLAAVLTTVQMGLFALLVWAPRIAAGEISVFQTGEVVVTFVLTASAWVVADSYREQAWFAVPVQKD